MCLEKFIPLTETLWKENMNSPETKLKKATTKSFDMQQINFNNNLLVMTPDKPTPNFDGSLFQKAKGNQFGINNYALTPMKRVKNVFFNLKLSFYFLLILGGNLLLNVPIKYLYKMCL